MMIATRTALTTTMMMMMTSSLTTMAFVPVPHKKSSSTSSTTILYLEDRIANMIDNELYRQQHQKEFEQEWMEKNRGAVLHSLNKDSSSSSTSMPSSMLDDDAMLTQRQLRKDKYMADTDPQRYCADRCVATGNCEVYEDIFQFSPTQVLEFCEECVLSEDEDPCDIPEVFFMDDPEDAADAAAALEDANDSKFKP